MKIDLNEIWEFIDMAPEPKTADKGDRWIYELVAGDVVVKNLESKDIANLKKEENYDTELLPSIFTFREILWQPNVYTEPALCVPQLNILKVFCEEYVEELKQSQNGNVWPYFSLLHGLGHFCGLALKKIASTKKKDDINISGILGTLRKNTFPIVKFFIFHPMNRADYQRDALNRLNYAVKIMLTQYNNKYFDLHDPYWNVTIGKPEKPNAKKAEKIEHPSSEASTPSEIIRKSNGSTPPVPEQKSKPDPTDIPENEDHLIEEF